MANQGGAANGGIASRLQGGVRCVVPPLLTVGPHCGLYPIPHFQGCRIGLGS